MDDKDYSTKGRKYRHLSRDERYEIQVRLKDGWSIYKDRQGLESLIQHHQAGNHKR